MGIYTRLPEGIDEVDIIIAGGGTAGCVVASRLADADPSLSILVVEGGQNNKGNHMIAFPLIFPTALLPTSTATLFYKGNAEPQLDNREMIVPAGGVLGGGSSINLMMYSRAQRHDWDSWATPGCSADETIPFLKKLETYHGPGPDSVHGKDGPIVVSHGTFYSERAADQFIAAANEVGYPTVEDLQDLETSNGVQRSLRFVDSKGRRQDAASNYLHPKLEDGLHPNLHVLVETKVIKILFEGKRAVGVEFKPNPAFQKEDNTNVQRVKARKLVIGSCGALGTPLLLERSGLGDEAILNKAGVSVVAHIPGIGRNYQDHHLLIQTYYSALEPNETFDAPWPSNAPIMGWNGQDASCKLRPTEADVTALGPEFEAAYARDYLHTPDKPLALMALLGGFPGDPSTVEPGQYLAISLFTVYPYARGHVHITNGILSDLDVKKLIWAYKKQREIVRRMDVYRGEFVGAHPLFAEGSAAALVKLDKPNDKNISNIQYTAEDDKVIEGWVRKNVGTTWHSLGTCKMGALADGGVIDADLNVHGIEGLKLVDLSVVPQNIGANTATTAYAIGEKAATIILKDLGIAVSQ
ncbi:GMC oxidoreductase-domain-containing protein [Aspergillus welwitschiae]|uniref:GMC oxidoreductase-domain-containing protein n=1 Tax=Aspergillus welwitschiae TaxID=1341132 RepID=A0A3F3PI32_9EURO|nr:GMC oxidoreductase-domain-containing protein [Aspergillus welwitschiae]RDH26413.1 GMC oxidoreductase-domain-containing protein [Aspergillus welwitschiae]